MQALVKDLPQLYYYAELRIYDNSKADEGNVITVTIVEGNSQYTVYADFIREAREKGWISYSYNGTTWNAIGGGIR